MRPFILEMVNRYFLFFYLLQVVHLCLYYVGHSNGGKEKFVAQLFYYGIVAFFGVGTVVVVAVCHALISSGQQFAAAPFYLLFLAAIIIFGHILKSI